MLGGADLAVGVLLDGVGVVTGARAFVCGGRSPISTKRSCVIKAWRSLTALRSSPIPHLGCTIRRGAVVVACGVREANFGSLRLSTMLLTLALVLTWAKCLEMMIFGSLGFWMRGPSASAFRGSFGSVVWAVEI